MRQDLRLHSFKMLVDHLPTAALLVRDGDCIDYADDEEASQQLHGPEEVVAVNKAAAALLGSSPGDLRDTRVLLSLLYGTERGEEARRGLRERRRRSLSSRKEEVTSTVLKLKVGQMDGYLRCLGTHW